MLMFEKSEHVVTLLETFELGSDTYIVTKYVKGGNLMNFLLNTSLECSNEQRAQYFTLKIALGISDLHKRGIVHRDIKLLNVFVGRDKDAPKVKIGDFDLACKLKPKEMTAQVCGTLDFMSPEVVQEHYYSFKTDVWSLGVILYILITHKVPFEGANGEEIRANIVGKNLDLTQGAFKGVSDECRALLAGMLRKEQTDRFTIEDVISHPWF